MVALIFQPTKTAMQSGRAKTNQWILQYNPESPSKIEPLMGYNSSKDMKQQIKLYFDTQEEAISYAERNNIIYQIILPKVRRIRPNSYADNFKYNRKQAWTH